MQRARALFRSTAAAALLVAAAACEDTPLLVPSDGQILMAADPVQAEPRAADPTGETLFSTIDATVLSATGQVLPGVQVTFTRSGGRLCLTESGCLVAQAGPLTVETDADGRARVILGATEADPATVDVIARSGTKEATVSVTNPIGEALPIAVVASSPSAVACEFDATLECVYSLTAMFAAQVSNNTSPVTCYRWALVTSGQSNPAAQFGADLAQFNPTAFTVEQQVDASVSVTDEAGSCDSSTTFEAQDSVTIRVCNPANTAPVAVILDPVPATQTLPGGSGSVTFNVSSTGTNDAQTPANQLDYRWDCGNGSTPTGATASCTYNTAGQKVITLTVFDLGQGQQACRRRGTDTVTVTVLAAT